MKIKIIPFFLVALLISCVPKEQVVLKSIQDVVVEPGPGKNPILKAKAIFYNPNNVQMKLKEINMEVMVDGKKSAHAEQKLNSIIKAKSDFTVPLEVQLSFKEMGLLDTILGFIGGKKHEIRYVGYIRVRVHGLTIKVPVDQKEEVRLKI